MPAELAMLHQTEPTRGTILEAFAQVCPDGSAVELRGGQITALLDDLGRHVMTIFPATPIEVDAAVQDVGLIGAAAAGARYWTDITIPLGDDGARLNAARALAQLTNGRLYAREGGEVHV
jgi:hypothetical protein